MNRKCAPFLALLFTWIGAYAQSTAKPEFEVASIKPSPPLDGRVGTTVSCFGGPGSKDPGLFTCQNMDLSGLVTLGYSANFWQLSAPDWMTNVRFDLRATVLEGATKEQFRLMLQNLLADRFKLVVRHETREIRRYELTIGKGGPKFKESEPPATNEYRGTVSPFPLKTDKDGYPVVRRGMAMIAGGKARMHWPEMTMETLVAQLSGQLRGPVTDLTGLTGKYDIDLYWTADNGVRATAPGADPVALPSEPGGPTLQQALQDQLGLRLESKKGPVDFLVVDHAEKVPTEN